MEFSKRHGHTKVSDIIIFEEITPEIAMGIANWLSWYGQTHTESCRKTEILVWSEKLNKDIDKFPNFASALDVWAESRYVPAIKNHILSNDLKWYKKLDLIESIFQYAKATLNYCCPIKHSKGKK